MSYEIWILTCSMLVFFMQVGFACLETGIARKEYSTNVAVKNSSDFSISLLIFWIVSYSTMFGTSLIPDVNKMLFGTFDKDIDASKISHFIYQSLFMSTAVTILSGAVMERLNYKSFIYITIFVSLFIYPVIGHLAWNDSPYSFLYRIGFKDFAGSTIVHGVGGWVALAVLLAVGPRHKRFSKSGKVLDIPPSNLALSTIGMLLMWCGWLGFNGGSVSTLDEDLISKVLLNTFLGGVAGFTTTLIVENATTLFKPNPLAILNGPLAGLVAVTACADILTPFQSMLLASSGAIITTLSSYLMIRLKLDDPVDAVSVHLSAGIWGTIVGPIIATSSENISISSQIIGVALSGAISFIPTYAFILLLKRFSTINIRKEEKKPNVNLNFLRNESRLKDMDLPSFPKGFLIISLFIMYSILMWIAYSSYSSGIELIDSCTKDLQTENNHNIFVSTFIIFIILGVMWLIIANYINNWRKSLESSVKKIKESDRIKSTFVSNISHEFKTPLNIIVGISEFLKEDIENEDYIEPINRLNSVANKLNYMTKNIIDLLCIQSGDFKLYNSEFKLESFINDINGFVEEKLSDNKNKIQINTTDDKHIIYTDYKRLKQITVIMILNANKFTTHGKINVDFNVINKKYLKISVSDNGVGFSKEMIDMAFSSFVQDNSFINKKYEGIGISLTLAQEISKIMGGEITIKSKEGEYSKVSTSLPIVK